MALARHSFVVQDEDGNLVPTVQIEVRQEDVVGNPLALLYEDRDGLVPLGNPVVLNQDADGLFFHVAGGAYSIEITTDAGTLTRRYVAVGLAQERDAEGDFGALAYADDASEVPFTPASPIAGTDVQTATEEVASESLRPDTTNLLSVGYTATAYDGGTQSSGTYTPAPANGNFQRYINGGAHTLAPPAASGDYTIVIQITNNGSAGAITTSGFTKMTGDSFTTTNGHDFLAFITKLNGFTHLHVTALQ